MKKYLIIAIAFLGFATHVMAQNIRAWGTYYTGTGQVWPNGEERGNSCITDASGNVYLVGYTSSNSDIATAGAHQTVHAGGPTIGGTGNYDAFLVKFNSSGVRQWATYYGGSENDKGLSCAVDASGNVYMIGSTGSTSGIATAGAYDTTFKDGFLVKFNSNGVRQWGTYFESIGNACAVDVLGNIYISGTTQAKTGIATAGAHQNAISGSNDAFLVKFNSNGEKQWGTYFGGSLGETGLSCATDAFGNVYMAGMTSSTSGIATAGAHDMIYGGSLFSADAFIVKFNSSGAIQWGTYYGSAGVEIGYSCATDASGNVYLAGDSQQERLPDTSGMTTSGAHQTAYGGGYSDAFLVKFDPNGTREWGTYYGGNLLDVSFSCATDASGNVYISGETQSTTGIATPGAHQSTLDKAFLVCFNTNGVRQSGTYYGGLQTVCTTDASGNVYMTGYTQSKIGIATDGAHQTARGNNGYNDAFLVKFSNTSVGVNDFSNKNSPTIYPNPTKSIVNVNADKDLVGIPYAIYSNSGKVVISGKINTENTSIDMGNLSTGIYLLRVGENSIQTFKVIKE